MFADPARPSKRILVADDDPLIRHLVTSIVRKEGYSVVVANDGREALRLLQADHDFTAAIFDMMMPNLGGLDLIRRMRLEKHLLGIPVLLVTSDRDWKVLTESFAAGATLFLPKPFTADQMRNTLRMLLSSARISDDSLTTS
jgi:CheY-like chemotaxis protein